MQWFLLALLCSMAALPACKKGADGAAVSAGKTPAAPAADASSAEQVYAVNRCATCHGDNLEGKPRLGPALSGLKAKWSGAGELVKYLEDPRSYTQADPRLSAQAGEYTMAMPALPMTPTDRAALAKWLLEH
jgi:mono/diheme cytochrome c family protein